MGENGDLALEAIWIVASFIFGVGAAMTINSAPEYSPLWALCIITIILFIPGILWGCIYLLGFAMFLIFVLIVLALILIVVLGTIQFFDTFVFWDIRRQIRVVNRVYMLTNAFNGECPEINVL